MYRAVLFDLYDTVVLFHAHVPVLDVHGTRWRSTMGTMGWMTDVVAHEVPGVTPEDFLRAITETTAEIVRNRPPEYFEIPSRERFRRALVRLGVADPDLAGKADRLSRAHMQHIAASTHLPAEHLDFLRGLAARAPLGLISNFDRGETAREILARDGLAELFTSIVISDGFGRRKPHPAIFHQAVRQLGVAAAEAVFVGDSFADDVCGARGAGLDAVWLNPAGAPIPEGGPAPTHVIARLTDLAAILASD